MCKKLISLLLSLALVLGAVGVPVGAAAGDDITLCLYNTKTDKQISTISATVGDPYTIHMNNVSEPSMTGYNFMGWSETDGGTKINMTSPIPDGTNGYLFLYTIWEAKTVSVTYDFNYSGKDSATKAETFDEAYNLPTETEIGSNPGNNFIGWFDSRSGGRQIAAGILVNKETAHTLYAHWSAQKISVKLFYNTTGGDIPSTPNETPSLGYGSTVGSIKKPTRTGYTCVWHTGNANGTVVSDDEPLTDGMELYASWTENTYKVTLSPNGGTFETAPTTQTVTFNKPYGSNVLDPKPKLDGYEFSGWATTSSGEVLEDTDIVETASDHTLYAIWKAKEYEITYDYSFPKSAYWGAGGTEPTLDTTSTATYNSAYPALPTPPAADIPYYDNTSTQKYAFDGWYDIAVDTIDPTDPTKNVTGHKITGGTNGDTYSIAGNQKLYARWTYTLTFDPNGGTLATTTQQFTTGKAMGTLPTPTRAGYSFEGWYTSADPSGSDSPFTANTIADPDEDGKKLYAKWSARPYTVTLDPNGGTLADDKKAIDVTYDKQYPNIKTDNAPTRTGYTFKGWFTEKDGGSEVTSATKVEVTNNNTTLYAHWEPKTYTLRLNYKLPADLDAEYEIPALTKKQIKTGEKFLVTDLPSSPAAFKYNDVDFTFFDWYTSEGNEVNNDTELTAAMLDNDDQHVTLYARWKYKVEFYNNTTAQPGSRPDSTVEFVTGTPYGEKLPAPERTGMTFAGWFPNPDGTGREVTETSDADGKTFKLYARWTTSNYRIVLNENGGAFSETQTIRSGYFDHNDQYGDFLEKYIPAPPAGHSFAGWFTEAEGGTEVSSTDRVTQTRTLYAHWKPDQFKVTLDPNYTGSSSTVKTVDYDTKLSDLLTPDPERTGYAFEGWFTDKACENAVNKEETVKSDLTFYAKWIKAKRVDLAVGGGALPEGVPAYINVYEGGKYNLPVPTWLGCDFEGWYTLETGGTIVQPNSTVPAESQIPDTLYARWTPKKVRVSFNYNGPSTTRQPKEYPVGSKYTLLPNALWAGYQFMGWYTKPTGGERITSDTVVSVASDRPEDLEITIYAHWGYTVAFEPGEGFGSMDSEVAEMNQPYTLPTCTFTPPDGMRFGGWAVGSPESPTQPGGSQYTVTRNLTLYATWTTAPIVITSSCTSGGSLATADGGVNSITVERGQDVTFIATANTGYVLQDLQVDGVSFNYTDVYTFRNVIEDHTIHAVFAPVGAPSYSTCAHGKNCPLSRYSDLDPNTWYHDGVHFCIDNVIMGGSSSTRFNPGARTSRGEIAVALWNHADRPDSLSRGPLRNTYPDVKPSDWYYQAVEWATGETFLTGYSNGRFGPNDPVTREQLVTILWRHAGSPSPKSTVLRFYDSSQVSGYAWEAMCWATEQRILQGRSTGYLVPKGTATRAEVATMLMNYLG